MAVVTVKGDSSRNASNARKKRRGVGECIVVVHHVAAPDACLRLQRAVEIVLGACPHPEEEVAKQPDVREDQGSKPVGDGDGG